MKKTPRKLLLCLIIAGCVALCITGLWTGFWADAQRYILGALVCAALVTYTDTPKIKPFELSAKSRFLWMIPAFLIAVNNFPWISAVLSPPTESPKAVKIAGSLFICMLCALFEEMLFRRIVLSDFLKKYENTQNRELKAIFLSSVLFGAYHLINIFYGASVPQTILQFFYTVPIGAMMCLVYLVSGKLVFCVLIHGIYSFAGDLVSVIGIKDQWNTPEVILTAAVSFAVFVIYLGFFASKTKK